MKRGPVACNLCRCWHPRPAGAVLAPRQLRARLRQHVRRVHPDAYRRAMLHLRLATLGAALAR